jgi:lipoate-protein ligase A
VGIVDRAGVSAGVSVDAESPALLRARGAGLPVSRRTTGGTIVVASPGDLVWSLVLPVASEGADRPRLHAYARLGEGVTRWLERSGVRASWGEAFGYSDEFCLLGPRGSVLVADGRALAGAAQHRSAHALLHHGLIVRTIDRRRLARLFAMDPRVLRQTTTSLEELGVMAPAAELARRLADSLRSVADEW